MGSLADLEKWGYLFYVASPNRTSFETVEEVPDYSVQVVPHFFILFVLEQCFMRKRMRVNDSVTSMIQGSLSEMSRIIMGGWKIAAYIYIYQHWRIATLPWNSAWTWWAAFLIVDFIYYWAHRASHEINIFWASHQVHHSSEEYNLSTALRQSIFQSYMLSIFYLPMAFAVPPSVFVVHSYFNLLFQFWIHTELITSTGPLEYVLNTPSHHRVHHGRNRYCIDKNYAGCLIIWDRMFGTFEAENEKVVYGLTHPINSFDPFYIQFSHFLHIWRTFWSTTGVKNKVSVILKGPGWSPGTPWHGNIEDIPEVSASVEKFDPKVPNWCKLYVFIDTFMFTWAYHETMQLEKVLPPAVCYYSLFYITFWAFCIGALLEGRQYAPWVEVLRCVLYVPMDIYFLQYTTLMQVETWTRFLLLGIIRINFLVSGIFWTWHCMKNVTITFYSKKTD